MTKSKGWITGAWLLAAIILSGPLFAQKKVPSSFCLHPAEKQLADSINRIRVRNGKKALPLSVSLSYVARAHVADLFYHHPDTSICNLSSWSDKGPWKAVCYNPYVVNHDGMWKKPQELTNYPYRGYEMVAYSQDNLVVDSVLSLWEDSPEAMAMILARGVWKKKSWACMGVGINKHYASVWYGQRPDRAGRPKMCRSAAKATKKGIKKQPTENIFYLIYGSYPSLNSANKALGQVRARGFRHTGIIHGHGHIRVYLYHSTDFQKIKNERQRWKKKFPQLWILQK